MNMAKIDTKLTFDNKGEQYNIEVPAGDVLILRVGQNYGSAGSRFSHSNIAAKKEQVFGFKHYRKNGGKFWTYKAGIEFFFVIPKTKIDVLEEVAYSYPKVEIGGEIIALSVSGGTMNGWTDWITPICSTLVGFSQKKMKAIADNALSPKECKEQGYVFDIHEKDSYSNEDFQALCAKKDVQAFWKKNLIGTKIHLAHGYSYGGETGPFLIVGNYKQSLRVLAEKHYRGYVEVGRDFPSYLCCRVKRSQIDYVKTAEDNGIPLQERKVTNYVGDVIREEDMQPV